MLQINKKSNSAPFILLCLDESIDNTKSARLALFARYCVGNIIKEELIAITSLLTATKGTDICTAIRNSPAEKDIDLKKFVSVTTDSAANMVGKKNGFISLFKTDVGHSFLECHCIIHQQALCAKSGLTSLDNVITLVTKIVNLISSQALNKRKFDALLDEVNSVYNGLIMYNNVRWLSRGNVLQRFVDFLEEIRLFLQNESKIEQYRQLMDIMWLLKLMFFTDICQHFNELNIKLQGPNKTVIVMMDLIHVFEAKLYVFRNDIITKNYKYFPNLNKNIKDLDAQEKRNEEKVIDDFISIIDSLIKEFSARFSQFKELLETFKFIIEANPQVYVETPLHPEKLTVWCALWPGGIIGPYFYKNDEGHNVTVNGDRYRAMITNFFIPELNNHDVQELWFQQDGATCHTARATIDLLKDTIGDRLISRFGPVNWPPRSCDLTPLDYFLWAM
ncbi:general transcription factor II-I repeat domain-containing protein 2A [Trichonephila clavipes]|nr:general transcription factor II-I repeat domain-containing protein 2A [Trichonephila clavipes]